MLDSKKMLLDSKNLMLETSNLIMDSLHFMFESLTFESPSLISSNWIKLIICQKWFPCECRSKKTYASPCWARSSARSKSVSKMTSFRATWPLAFFVRNFGTRDRGHQANHAKKEKITLLVDELDARWLKFSRLEQQRNAKLGQFCR